MDRQSRPPIEHGASTDRKASGVGRWASAASGNGPLTTDDGPLATNRSLPKKILRQGDFADLAAVGVASVEPVPCHLLPISGSGPSTPSEIFQVVAHVVAIERAVYQ
jgi:hypothetical protein